MSSALNIGPFSYLGVPERFLQTDLISTNAVNAEPAYAPGTYDTGDRVLYTLTPEAGWMKGVPLLRVMECVSTGPTTAPPTDATRWLNTGPANTVAMFASRLLEKTRRVDGLTVLWQPQGAVDYVALFGLEGRSVTVRVKTPAGAVRSEHTTELITYPMDGWDDFFLADPVQQETVLVRNLVCLPGDRIEVQLTGNGVAGSVAVGRVSYGKLRWLATTPEYGYVWETDNYPSRDPDEFGDVENRLNLGDYAPRAALTAYADINRANEVAQLVVNVRAWPTVFVATDQSNLSTVAVLFGLITASVTVAGPTHVLVSGEVKGFV